MPKTRLSVPLDEDLYSTIRRFASLTGKSSGITIYELLKQSEPHLIELCEIIEQVEEQKAHSGESIKEFVSKLTSMSEQNLRQLAFEGLDRK